MNVQTFLSSYYHVSELCEEFPPVDDIFSGVLELKTPGVTSTRSLSRQVLFHILQWCPVIDVDTVNTATNGQYAYTTAAGYAALARVASKALERFIARLPVRTTTKDERAALDAPYMAELAALGLV